MGLLRRVFTSLVRNWGKTVVLLLITFVLTCVIAGAISVQQAIQNAENNIRANLPTIVSVEFDMDGVSERAALVESLPEGDTLTFEMLNEIAELPYVRNSDVVASTGFLSAELTNVLVYEFPLILYDYGDEWAGVEAKGVRIPNFVDLEEGLVELYSGRNFSEEDLQSRNYVMLASRNFAELNGIGIGSIIPLELIVWDYSGHTGTFSREHYVEENIFIQRTYHFEIIGIFEPSSDIDTGFEHMDKSVLERLENRVYVPNVVAGDASLFFMEQFNKVNEGWVQGDLESHIYREGFFVLHDPLQLEDFKAAVLTIVPLHYGVMTTNDSLDKVIEAMTTVSNLFSLSLWVAIGASIAILSILMVLTLRDRRREIGIYLALGERKTRIISQVVLEVLFVTLIAATLSLLAGNIIANSISESMLREDIIAAQASELRQGRAFSSLDNMGFSTGESANEMLARYDASLDLRAVLLFYLTILTTVMASTIIPMSYLMKLNPKKILM